MLGRRFEVPENNLLLRQLAFVAADIAWGRYCWNGECRYCEIHYRATDGPELAALSCRVKGVEGMRITKLAPGDPLQLRGRPGRQDRQPTSELGAAAAARRVESRAGRLPPEISEPSGGSAPAARSCVRLLRVISRRRAVNSEASRSVSVSCARATSLRQVWTRMSSALPAALSRCDAVVDLRDHALDLAGQLAQDVGGGTGLLERRHRPRGWAPTGAAAASAGSGRALRLRSSRKAREKRNGNSAFASSNSFFAASLFVR